MILLKIKDYLEPFIEIFAILKQRKKEVYCSFYSTTSTRLYVSAE